MTDKTLTSSLYKNVREASVFSFLLTLLNVAVPDTLYRRQSSAVWSPKLALGGLTVRPVSVVITLFLKSSSPCPLSVPANSDSNLDDMQIPFKNVFNPWVSQLKWLKFFKLAITKTHIIGLPASMDISMPLLKYLLIYEYKTLINMLNYPILIKHTSAEEKMLKLGDIELMARQN